MFAEQPHPDTGQLNVLNAGLDVVRLARFLLGFRMNQTEPAVEPVRTTTGRRACCLNPNSTCCVTSRHNTHDVSRVSWRAGRACLAVAPCCQTSAIQQVVTFSVPKFMR